MRIEKVAPAKLNLNLHITGRRDDGYHLLDSIMVFTQWGDHVAVELSDNPSVSMIGNHALSLADALLSADRDSPNLAVKALYLMADATGHAPNIKITVEKNIPAGAGLAGGSSDAAAVMHALNELWDCGFTIDRLSEIGLKIGAEMPVCLHARPARVQGIGDIITPVDIAPLNIVIAWPESPLLTADVFQAFRQQNAGFDERFTLSDNIIEDIQKTKNTLTKTAIQLCPEIGSILDILHNQKGCLCARMTGTGSACFGVFDTITNAEKAANQFTRALATQTI
jgi:4-diphosphocytidyl-2-C-methyl-D-erythritol kinase